MNRHRLPAIRKQQLLVLGLTAFLLALPLSNFAFRLFPVTLKLANSEVTHGTGNLYYVPLGTLGPLRWLVSDSKRHPTAADLRLYENGTPLSPPHQEHRNIARGEGGFSFSQGVLYFAALDGSNPAENGRVYSATARFALDPRATFALWLVGVASLLARARTQWSNTPENRYFASRIAGIVLYGLLFVSARGFTGFSPIFDLDSRTYTELAEQFRRGEFGASFERTYFVPALMALVYKLGGNDTQVVGLQTAVSFLGGLLLMRTLRATSRAPAWLAGLLAGGVLALPDIVFRDVFIMSESLFTSFIMMSSCALVLGLTTRRCRWLVFASAMAGFSCAIRPAGVFMLPLLGLAACGALWVGLSRNVIPALVLPVTLAILPQCIHHGISLGRYSISTFGPLDMLGTTSTYWEPPPDMDPDAAARARTFVAQLEPGVHETVLHSWNYRRLLHAFDQYYGAGIAYWFVGVRGENQIADKHLRNQRYLSMVEQAQALTFHSIRTHPQAYFKWVTYNFARFILYLPSRMDPIGYQYRYWRPELLRDNPIKVQTHEARGIPIEIDARLDAYDPVTVLVQRWHQWLMPGYKALMINRLWPLLAGIAFFAALPRLLRRRLDSGHALSIVLLTLMVVGKALMVCLVEVSLPRYTQPVAYAAYLIPWLWFWQLRADARPRADVDHHSQDNAC